MPGMESPSKAPESSFGAVKVRKRGGSDIPLNGMDKYGQTRKDKIEALRSRLLLNA